MSVQLLNQLFQNHFNGGNPNGNTRVLVLPANRNSCAANDCGVSDGKKKRELKSYKAIFIHYTGEEDNGMDSEVIQAYSYQEAYSIACKMPGRVYKLTEINL